MYTGRVDYKLDITEYTAGPCKGYVFKTKEELGEGTCVGFYVPKILQLVDAATGPAETSGEVNTGIFANQTSAPSSVDLVNYLKVPYNGRANFSQPMIALGETAQLFFLNGDYKEPRYTDFDNDERRRKVDKIRLYVNAKSDSDNEADCYYVELNGVDGKLHLHTSTENGEAHAYDMMIDAAGSKFVVNDDDGNSITLSTEDKAIDFVNSSGSTVSITDKDISCKCDGDFSVDCDNFNVKTKTAIQMEGGAKLEAKAPKMTFNADSMYELTTAMCKVSANSTAQFDTPTFLVSGMIGAPTVGVSSAPMSPPAVQASNAAGATLTQAPMGLGALGDRTLAAIMAILPFTILPPAAAAAVSPLAGQILQPMVRL